MWNYNRRRLVEVEHVLEHAPGKGQLAFSYTKRNGELNVTSTPTATMTTNQPLNPLLASLAASRMQCSSYFIEPMEWMGNLLDGQVEGRIDCPKCMSKLGQYNWAGAQCSCGRWITPAFMLHRKQVDEMKNQLPTSSRPWPISVQILLQHPLLVLPIQDFLMYRFHCSFI